MAANNLKARETPAPSACPYAEQAATWAVGALDAALRPGFEVHRAHCPACSADAQAFGELVARLRAANPDVPVSSDLTDRILASLPSDAFHDTRRSRVLRFIRGPVFLRTAAAAAALLALGWWVRAPRAPIVPAMQDGCAWLARQQDADGAWNPARSDGNPIYRPALTALSTLALNQGGPPYREAVASACRALVRMQEPDGGIGPENAARMYNHALATCALLAVHARGAHPELLDPITRALAFTRSRQQAAGGWGYTASADSAANAAITAWQVHLLSRATAAGWSDSGGHLRKGLAWLRGCADAQGQFGYTAGDAARSATPTLNAMGAYTLLSAGGSYPELLRTAEAAVTRLRTTPQPAETDLYRAFFLVAAWDASGDRSRASHLRRDVCARRERSGSDQGSWAPADAWGKVGGRLYTTSIAVLTLQPHRMSNAW